MTGNDTEMINQTQRKMQLTKKGEKHVRNYAQRPKFKRQS